MKNIIKYILAFLFLLNSIFAYYQVGDVISIEDQLHPLNVCYGEYPSDTLRLADFSSQFHTSANKVIFFRMTASWWGPSCADVPYFDDLHSVFENQPIVIFENVDDLYQPYSCEQWGNFGEQGIPILTFDGNSGAPHYFFNLFGGLSYTWSVILGPDMVVRYSNQGSISASVIQSILDEYQTSGDVNNDGIINIQDLILTINLILDGTYVSSVDFNYDNIIDILDLVLLIDIILS